MKIMVLLWSTSVEKDINIVPYLFFSHFFGGHLWPLFFVWASLASFIFIKSEVPSRLVGDSLHHPFLTWDNALIIMIITLLFTYNSILEQNMTLCECLRWCTGICNESRVTCMKQL